MIWPNPPRKRPAPPLPGRISLRHTMIGPTCSVASTLMVRTPDGKAVAVSPSRPGRAPLPPLLNISISTGGRGSPGSALRALAWKFHSAPDPSAGTTSGRAWAIAPRHRSVTKWPITWRMATGLGSTALRIAPGGALTVKGSNEA